MPEYKVLKGTRRTLYLRGLKSVYFYIFCFAGGAGAIVIMVFGGIQKNILLHIIAALIYVAVLYIFFFFLSIERPFKKVPKRFTTIRNLDLIKILKR